MPNLVFAPIEAILARRPGETILDSWWIHRPGHGVAFHKSGWGLDPQCNANESIAERIRSKLYPDEELFYIPTAYLGNDEGASLCNPRVDL